MTQTLAPRPAPGIRFHLAALVLLAMAPLAALLGYHIYAKAQADARQAAGMVERLAAHAAEETEDFIARSRELLVSLSARPLVRALDPRRCDPLFGVFREFHPQFANVLTSDRDGKLICSAVAVEPGRPTRAPSRLRELVRTDRFAIGHPAKGLLTDRWAVTLAQPVRGADGALAGVVGLPVDLLTLQFAPMRGLAQGTVVRIVDSQGTILASSEDPQQWVGQRPADSEMIRRVPAGKTGTVRAAGIDGIERIYAFAPVAATGWHAISGVPVGAVYGPAYRDAAISAAAVLVVLLVILWLARRAAVQVARPLEELAAAARRATVQSPTITGDPLPQGAPQGPRELRLLAQDFYAMLDARAKAEQALRESEEQYRGLVETMSEGLGVHDQDGLITFVNKRGCEMLGYELEELIGKPVTLLFDESNQTILREQMAKRRGTVRESYEIAWTRKDGTRVDTIISPRPAHKENGSYAGSVAVFTDITERKRAEQGLRESTRRLEELSRRLLQVQEDERRSIGGELHDRVGQTLSALGAHLELARVALPARSRERARPHLARARELIELSTAHMRELMAELRPPGLEQYGLLAALRVYTRALVALDGAKLELRGKDLVPRPPLQIETALYRIAQEALVNALRHAQPQRVKVHLEQSEDSVTLSIADDGVGFDITRAGPRPSWGLDVMRERAEALGARLHVDSGPGRGTRVSVELPWAAA